MDAFHSATLETFSLSEVRKHDTVENLWMILYNKVYDITSFASTHPGGVEVLIDCGGVDATEAFEDVGHSKIAYEMLEPFLIGSVSEREAKLYKHVQTGTLLSPSPTKESANTKTSKRRSSVKTLVFLAVLACVAFVCLQRLKWANMVS